MIPAAPPAPIVTFSDWYDLASEFFCSCRGASLEQIESGHQCLQRTYSGLGRSLSTMEQVQAGAIFQLADGHVSRVAAEQLIDEGSPE